MKFLIFLHLLSLVCPFTNSASKEHGPVPASGYRCPLYDINFEENDAEEIEGIDAWEECGLYL